jgi:hypothetical protein
MKIDANDPPREFEVGWGPKVTMKDCAKIALGSNEQVTFTTEAGGEYDVARKDWGFYATPSVNGRLGRFGLKAVLVRNKVGQFYVMLIEDGHQEEFDKYATEEEFTVCGFLDDETLPAIADTMLLMKK